MQPENDNRYPQLSIEEQLDLAVSVINNMMGFYLGACGNKWVKPKTVEILKAAELLSAYSGETEGPGAWLQEEWYKTQREWAEYKMRQPEVPMYGTAASKDDV